MLDGSHSLQSTEGPNRTKRCTKGNFSFFLLELGHPSFLPSHIRALGSPAFRLGLNYTTDFPACRWHIMRLLSLHNCVSQFPQIISSYISLYILLVLFLQRNTHKYISIPLLSLSSLHLLPLLDLPPLPRSSSHSPPAGSLPRLPQPTPIPCA